MEPKKKGKRRISILQLRVLLAVFIIVLVLQGISSLSLFLLVERDLKSKRAVDMDSILDSVSYSLTAPNLIDSGGNPMPNATYTMLSRLLQVGEMVYDELYPVYSDRLSEMTDGSELMSEYLAAFAMKRNEKTGFGMTQYGDLKTSIENLLSAIAAPSSSKFLYVGHVDEASNNFVVSCGTADDRQFGVEMTESERQVVSEGYFFPWEEYGKRTVLDKDGNEQIIGYEYTHPTKGNIYVSARRIYFVGTTEADYEAAKKQQYYVVMETDISFFLGQTRRFLLTFLITSFASFFVLFVGLGVTISFLFTRRINRLSQSAEDAVTTLQQGELTKHFSPSQSKHPDEINHLNDGIAYFEGEILSYIQEREAKIQEEERNRAEMAFSAQIQLSSLPDQPVDNEVISISPRIKLAKDVGGDLYDYFYIDDHRFLFLIGDVSGKGVPAALFMMQSIAKIRATLGSGKAFHLGEEIKAINDAISSRNPMLLFVTFFIGVVDTEQGTLTYVNCGHEEAFFRHEGEYKMLQGPSNIPLGAVVGFDFEMQTIPLSPSDSLFLYTDGASEAESVEGEFFGKPRIGESLNSLAHLPSNAIADEMLREVVEFQKGKEQSDDICMLSFCYRPGKKVVFDNKIENLDMAQDFIGEALSSVDNQEAISSVRLAMDELLTNVISYAYGEEKGDIRFELSVCEDERMIKGFILDQGVAFNPLEKAPNTDIANTPGGLGILIAKDALDDLEYYRERGFNVLRFNKKY